MLYNDDIFYAYDWDEHDQPNQQKSRLSHQRFSGVSSTNVINPKAKYSATLSAARKGDQVNVSGMMQNNNAGAAIGSGVFKTPYD